ncbi:MAG: helix-turn-helix transcriptional regulator [Deltaproteobacteria bacterium]|nr:helix-turn-helix transcriptional regulator [Deltaproteobacteria bacterium]
MRLLRPDNVKLQVARRLAELRRQAGFTQEDFATRIEVTVKYLQKVERGRQNLTLETLVKVANGLGVDLDVFFQEPSSMQSRPGRPPTRTATTTMRRRR